MTKAEIVNEVAKATGIEKATVLAVVENFTDAVKESLIAGNPVYLRGFGSFIIKHRAQKAARNITLPGMTRPFQPDAGWDYNPAADYHAGDAP